MAQNSLSRDHFLLENRTNPNMAESAGDQTVLLTITEELLNNPQANSGGVTIRGKDMVGLIRMISASMIDTSVLYPGATGTTGRMLRTFELELYDGQYSTCAINGRQIQLQKGLFIVGRPGDLRSSIFPFKCHCVHFITDNAALTEAMMELPQTCISDDYHRDVETMVKMAADFISDDPFASLSAAGHLMMLIRSIRQSGQTQKRRTLTEDDREILNLAEAYIDQHYMEDINTENIAKACHCSASLLYRLFAQGLSTTPRNMLNRRRMLEAKTILINDSCPIINVAMRCGFGSQSYFSDAFRRINGMSPVQFRKRFAPIDY